ncbi:MAG: hypothetical protein KAJ70_02460 [Candidatus Omnitrophica bacterium]|nr:hypothetical protein [Candidatus Omnitrophota bacterium]
MLKKILEGVMNAKILFLFLLALSLSACATKNQSLTEAIPLKIKGIYEGEANIDGDIMKVSILGVETEKLSTYKNVRPLTGGNRVPVYFDTDMENEGAEYCAFIYADEITFRRDDGVGWHLREIAVLSYLEETGNVYFDIPLKYFRYKPFRAWTRRMN